MSTENMSFSDFNQVRIAGAFDFEIARSDSFSVAVTKPRFHHIMVYKEGNGLVVYHPWYDVTSWFTPWVRPSVKVQMPDLAGLDVSGACEGCLTGFKSSNNLSLSVRGASRLTGDIASGDADYDIAGASRVEMSSSVKAFRLKLAGASDFRGTLKADSGEINIAGASKLKLSGDMGDGVIRAAGASHLDLKDLKMSNADVRLAGASRCSINASGKLDVDLSGACYLAYAGNPVMGSVKTAGASTITKA